MKRSERLYAVGQLAAGLAHEIRNPIASITGAAGILERNPEDPARRRTCIDIIVKECARLNRLLSSFLDFARPRPPSFKKVRLESLAESVIELASHGAGKAPVEFRREFDPALPEVRCDGEQIKEEESAAMVEFLCEGLGRDGWAVAGLEASREVLSKGLAECLILDEHFCPEPGYKCKVCGGRLPPGSPRSACLSCGSGLCVPYDEREAVVRAAVLGGAHIEIVNHSDALMRLGGVGCLLRPVPERYLYPVAA